MFESLKNKQLIAIGVALFAATSTLAFYSSHTILITTMLYVTVCGCALTLLTKIEKDAKHSDEFVNICRTGSKLPIPMLEDIILKKKSALDVFNYYLPLTTAMIVFSMACFVFSFSAMSYLPVTFMFISTAFFPLLALAFFGRKKSLQQEIAKIEYGFKEGPEWFFSFLEDGLNSSENAKLLKSHIDGVRAQGRNLTNMEFSLFSYFGNSNGAFKDDFDGDLKNRPI